MPVTPEQVNAIMAASGLGLSHFLPAFPGRNMTKAEAEDLVDLREHVAECFLLNRGQRPIIPDDGAPLRRDAEAQARKLMAGLPNLRTLLRGRLPYHETVLADGELDALVSSFTGALNGRRRALIWLLSDPAVRHYAESYVKNIAHRMLRSSAIMDSIDKVLFFVARDWSTSTVYERARGLDAARRYEAWIRNVAQKGVVTNSLSHSASPFLAQTRRPESRVAVWASRS
ncbi:hypothetical protein BCR35DRAFT_335512 [Leucosporidium creatinivorum]|uniref:Uncharacterized protein n=1 Tax=Leucosporidium creatinivorum TaxID=106004 RepID=A0A1Y2DAB1_9BASI|nr:hypothetical protein BCR35DRAFT_335512 [Leucosporidium creatinivorum]